MNYVSQLSDGLQTIVGLVSALYALASALSLVLGFVGNFYPPALVWARQCSSVGLRLHNAGSWLASLLPGGRHPAVTQALSLAAKPEGLTVACAECGNPVIRERT